MTDKSTEKAIRDANIYALWLWWKQTHPNEVNEADEPPEEFRHRTDN